ncbi:MAG: hypothetical protein AB7O73_06045 [Bacteroidia bacterium]
MSYPADVCIFINALYTWLDIFDLILPPFYLVIIYFVAHKLVESKINSHGQCHYRYLIPGLSFKIIGGIFLCLIYTYYYKDGGDVTNYFLTARTFVEVLYDGNLSLFSDMLHFKSSNIHLSGVFSKEYGPVFFRHNDYYALFTVVLAIPVVIIGCKSFITSTIVLCVISFYALWKLYEVFLDVYPNFSQSLAIAIFFIPSVFFWGSGILKDTFSMFSLSMFINGMYQTMILKRKSIIHYSWLIIASYFLINIKPYVLFALLPGTLIWLNFSRVQKIKNQAFKLFILPLILVFIVISVLVLLQVLGQYLGEYSLDNILQKAVKTQKDLVREQYGENYYNIGSFDATILGVLSKVPAALNMAIFRPYIWDANNPVMLLSGIENAIILFFTILIIIRLRIKILFKSLFGQPLLLFSLLFSLFFAFSVGLTTANYGALVRLKIPFVPFYAATLLVLYELNKDQMSISSIFNRKTRK